MSTTLITPNVTSVATEPTQADGMHVEVFKSLVFTVALTLLTIAMVAGAAILGSNVALLLAMLPFSAACFLGSFAAIRSCF